MCGDHGSAEAFPDFFPATDASSKTNFPTQHKEIV
jgi:hypothetical protein